MGTGMVHSLLRNGHDVTVWNRHEEKAKPLAADGARVESSSAAAVADADVVALRLRRRDRGGPRQKGQGGADEKEGQVATEHGSLP